MEGEKKIVDFKLDGDYAELSVDPNKDGEPVFTARIHIKELPDEVASALVKKK